MNYANFSAICIRCFMRNNGLIRVICVDNCPRDVTSVFMKSRCGKQCRSLTRSTMDSADSASNFNCEILKRRKML